MRAHDPTAVRAAVNGQPGAWVQWRVALSTAPMFVGYETGSDESERRVTAAVDAAAELGVRHGNYRALEPRGTVRGCDPDATQMVGRGAQPRILSPLTLG